MGRYLTEAFWARVRVAGLGALPVNALAVLGFGIVGCAEHAFWLLGAGLEAAYLYALSTHPRFQQVVAARDRLQERQDAGQREKDFLKRLPYESRERARMLAGKIARVAGLTRAAADADLLGDGHVDALGRLGTLHGRLLGIEQDLVNAQQGGDEATLARQAAALEGELAAGGSRFSAALRESKQATLALVQKRLANARRCAESLAEVRSDLARIETQVDVALEEASLEGKGTVAAGNFDLLNRILESNSALRRDMQAGGGAVDFEGM